MPARAHHGGVEILSDGTGDGRIERAFEFKPKAKPHEDGFLVAIVEVKKAINPESTSS